MRKYFSDKMEGKSTEKREDSAKNPNPSLGEILIRRILADPRIQKTIKKQRKRVEKDWEKIERLQEEIKSNEPKKSEKAQKKLDELYAKSAKRSDLLRKEVWETMRKQKEKMFK